MNIIKDDAYKQRALAVYVASRIMDALRSGKAILNPMHPSLQRSRTNS